MKAMRDAQGYYIDEYDENQHLPNISSSRRKAKDSYKAPQLLPHEEKHISAKKDVMTKTVYPEWYRRYAHVLPLNERIYAQPKRELFLEQEQGSEEYPMFDHVTSVFKNILAQIAKRKHNQVATVMKIVNNEKGAKELRDGLKVITDDDKVSKTSGTSISMSSHQRLKSVIPLLSLRKAFKKNSKWKQLKTNPIIRKKLATLILQAKSRRIRHRFVRAVRSVIAMVRFGSILADIARTTGSVFSAYEHLQEELKAKNIYFDKNKYKSLNEKNSVNSETIMALRMDESSRTDDMIQKAVKWLRRLRCFSSFPAYFQTIMATIGQFLELTKDKVVLRQGQPPQCFYFLISGKVSKTKLFDNAHDTRFGGFEIIETLQDDSMFGEEGMFGVDYREYSVVSSDKCQILSVANDDFFRLLNAHQDGNPPEHIRFLCELDFMQYFPKDKLIKECGDGIITMFYFQPDKVITPDINKSKFVYVVKTGKCSVFAEVEKSKKEEGESCFASGLNSEDESSTFINALQTRVKRDNNRRRTGGLIADSPKLVVISQRHSVDKNIRTSKIGDQFIQGMMVDMRTKHKLRQLGKINNPKNASKKSISPIRRRDTFQSMQSLPGILEGGLQLQLVKRGSYWVHMKELQETDSLGVESIDWGDGTKNSRFALVSNGSVCIAINKKFLFGNAGCDMTKMIRGSSFLLPSNAQLRASIKRQDYWNRYKEKIYAFEKDLRKR